jgi:predicted Zn-dependent protease
MRRLLSALFACLLTLQAAFAANPAVDLPDLGGPANAMLNKADEYQVGRMAMREFRNQNLILEDPEVTDYLQNLGLSLASQAHVDDQNFQYVAFREPVINAFATFGGFVCIFTGLILATDNEAELAAVMAHETGHVVQRHIARGLQAESRISLTSMAAMLAALIIGAAGGGSGSSGQAMEGAIALSQATALQQTINFTRGQEEEADAVGIELLAGAGYDPQQMAVFFETFSRMEGLTPTVLPALLIDHPVTSDRIAVARARAAQYPHQARYVESPSYAYMRERVRVLVATPQDNMVEYYEHLAAQHTLSPAERYGQALAQLRGNQAHAAVRTLHELQEAHPELTFLYAAYGQALEADKQHDASLALFERAVKLFPRNVPIAVRYAETLMQTGRAKQAHDVLLDVFNNVPPTPDQIRLTAVAANAAGDVGDAYYYMSEYDLSGGDLNLASQQLELALATPNLTSVQRQRFRARLEEVRGWLREQQQQRGTSGGRGG